MLGADAPRGGPLIFDVKPDRDLVPYLLTLTLIFAAAFAGGTAAPLPIRQQATEMFRLVADQYMDLAGGTLFFFILVHNVMASILLLASGLLVGIVPVLSVGSNGFFLGVLYRQAAEASGYSKAALAVLPHGIFEIPALLFAASYGLWLGVTVLRRIRGKESAPLGLRINHAFERYFTVVFPLLIVSAAIETFLILKGQ
jgi:stage II sporulation protein M